MTIDRHQATALGLDPLRLRNNPPDAGPLVDRADDREIVCQASTAERRRLAAVGDCDPEALHDRLNRVDRVAALVHVGAKALPDARTERGRRRSRRVTPPAE